MAGNDLRVGGNQLDCCLHILKQSGHASAAAEIHEWEAAVENLVAHVDLLVTSIMPTTKV